MLSSKSPRRPRAPSPPILDDDIYNTYSIVQDSVILGGNGTPKHHHHPPPPPPKSRMFGDSVNPSPAESVMSSSSGNSGRNGSLASLYQARNVNSGGNNVRLDLYKSKNENVKTYDAATVEEIKAQFQRQIESMLQSQERNAAKELTPAPPPQQPPPPPPPPIMKTHFESNSERELNAIQRGKSFDEARSAVQKHIERMFNDANNGGVSAGPKKDIKHTMHGVSHAIPGENEDIKPPPPVHYGVNQAIRNGINNRRMQHSNTTNKWQSVESLVSDAQSSSPDSNRVKFSNSMENVSSGLPRTLIDIDVENVDVSERMRNFKMTNGKSMPNLSNPLANGKFF